MEEDNESKLTTIRKKKDTRSDFDKAFDEDTLYQLQARMVAKAKTKRYTPEEFIKKAKEDLAHELELTEESASDLDETPEPEDDDENFF